MSALFGTTYGFALLTGLSFATVYAMHYYQQCVLKACDVLPSIARRPWRHEARLLGAA